MPEKFFPLYNSMMKQCQQQQPQVPKSSPWKDKETTDQEGAPPWGHPSHCNTTRSQDRRTAGTRNHTATRNSFSNSWFRLYLWPAVRGEEKYNKAWPVFAGAGEFKWNYKLLQKLCQLLPAVILNRDPELPVILAAQNYTMNPSPSSRVREHSLCSVFPPNQGGSNTRRTVAATDTVPSRHSAWQFLATSATCLI